MTPGKGDLAVETSAPGLQPKCASHVPVSVRILVQGLLRRTRCSLGALPELRGRGLMRYISMLAWGQVRKCCTRQSLAALRRYEDIGVIACVFHSGIEFRELSLREA